jgi:small subunit ribosomal protein S6
MRRYEMMVIVTDLLDEEAAEATFARAKEILAQQGGTLLDEAWWGRRRFGYEIEKRSFGYYGVLDFEATDEAVDETARLLRINDDVVRFKTVRPGVRVRKSA